MSSLFVTGSPLSRPSAWLVATVLGGSVLVAELLLAASIVSPRFGPFLALFVGVAGAALAFRFSFAGMVVLMLLVASLFHVEFIPSPLSLGSTPLHAYELMLALLLLVALVRPKRATWGGLPGAALALFLVLVTVASVVAVADGRVSDQNAVHWGRSLMVLTVFYVVIRLFPERADVRRLLTAAAVVGAATSLLALPLAFGDGLDATFQDPSGQVIRPEQGLEGLDRVRLPGVALAYGFFFYALTRLVEHGRRRPLLWSAVVAGCLLSIGLSLNRNMWVGVVFGLVLLLLMSGERVRWRLTTGLVVTAVAVAWLAGIGGVEKDTPLYPIVQRGSTLLDSNVSNDSSLNDRKRENRFALESFEKHPLTGIGLGTRYGAHAPFEAADGTFTRVPRRFVHNQYLYIALVGGIPALLCFLVFLAGALMAAMRGLGRDPHLVACGVGLAALMLSAVVMLTFTVDNLVLAVGLLAGSAFALSAKRDSSERDRSVRG